jgi:fructuronate reductase
VTDAPRLCDGAVGRLPGDVERPTYDRRTVTAGVVHIGPGAFHRAHQAVVFDDLLERGDNRWGITEVALRSTVARDALEPQDCLYCLAIRRKERDRLRIIGAVRRVLALQGDPWPIVEALAEPQVAIVTLTVTEAGYKPPVRGGQATAVGLLAIAIGLRRSRGLSGLTVISCDNIARNGERLGRLVLDTLHGFDPALADWAHRHVAFPSTMVDRITPATTRCDIEAFAERTGVRDDALVRAEAFSQWVIEDRFASPPPDFAASGVQVVRDVEPFETAKLRLLNGAHSAMAYLGGLTGLEFVHEFVADPSRMAFLRRLWDEVQTTLHPFALDIPAYRRALASRFADPAAAHRLAQIAIDGSQKLPQRLLAPLAHRLTRGLPSPALVLAVAAWIKWRVGTDDFGVAFDTPDVLSPTLRRRLSGLNAPGARVVALLATPEIFPPGLAASPSLRMALTAALGVLDVSGARRAMAALGPA